MSKGLFATLVLLALGLGAYVYFYEIKGEAAREAVKLVEKRIFSLKKEDIVSVTINNSKGVFEFEKKDSIWYLKNEPALQADVSAIEDIIYMMETIKYSQIIDEQPKSLEPFGLSQPQFSIVVNTNKSTVANNNATDTKLAGTSNAISTASTSNKSSSDPSKPDNNGLVNSNSYTLLVGKNAPFGGQFYVKQKDSPIVYLSSDPQNDKIDKDLFGWRYKKIIDFNVFEVERLTIKSKESSLLDAYKKGGNWFSSSNSEHNKLEIRLDPSAVESLLYALQGLNATSFVASKDFASYGLSPSQQTIMLEIGKDKVVKQLMIGLPQGEKGDLPVIQTENEEIRLVSSDLSEKINKDVSSLRDKRLIPLESFKINQILANGDNKKSSFLAKNKDDWTVSGDALKSDASSIVDQLTGLQAIQFLDDVKSEDFHNANTDKPVLKLNISADDLPKGLGVVFSRGIGSQTGKSFAKIDTENSVYEIPSTTLDSLLTMLLRVSSEPTKSATPEISTPTTSK